MLRGRVSLSLSKPGFQAGFKAGFKAGCNRQDCKAAFKAGIMACLQVRGEAIVLKKLLPRPDLTSFLLYSTLQLGLKNKKKLQDFLRPKVKQSLVPFSMLNSVKTWHSPHMTVALPFQVQAFASRPNISTQLDHPQMLPAQYIFI